MFKKFDFFADKVNNCYQLRAGDLVYTVTFESERQKELFIEITDIVESSPEIESEELLDQLSKIYDKEFILNLFSMLSDYDLEDSPKSSKFKTENILILGGGTMAAELRKIVGGDLFNKVTWHSLDSKVDDDMFRSMVCNSSFVVVDSTKWSPYYIEMVNRLSLEYKIPWLSINGLSSTKVEIGPLFDGSSDGCYNCMNSRLKSNLHYPSHFESYETYLRNQKTGAKCLEYPNDKLTAPIIAHLVLLELEKIIYQWKVPTTYRTVIRLDLLTLDIEKDQVLKRPYCEVCNPQLEYHEAPWLESVSL